MYFLPASISFSGTADDPRRASNLQQEAALVCLSSPLTAKQSGALLCLPARCVAVDPQIGNLASAVSCLETQQLQYMLF